MKTYSIAALALIIGFTGGGLAVEALHAPTKSPVGLYESAATGAAGLRAYADANAQAARMPTDSYIADGAHVFDNAK